MPNEPHQRNYLHGSFETPSTIPPTNPTKTKPLTPKESKSFVLDQHVAVECRRTERQDCKRSEDYSPGAPSAGIR